VPSLGQDLPTKGICAHRGASATYPENTKVAILEAINIGVQMIEFDVRTTKDNKLIVIHNKSVDKTRNGTGDVSELSLNEILELDAGSWKADSFKGIKIPTLEEILDIIPENIWMNIHIKDNDQTVEAVAKLLTERNQINNAILSVEKESAKFVRKINNKLKICCMDRGNSTDEYIANTIDSGADFIQLTEREFPVLDQVIPILKKNDIKVNFYYADSITKMKELFDAGVDFVLCNNVKQLVDEAKVANLFETKN
jgi:glycerophosphoryl diester phosphodiesterase